MLDTPAIRDAVEGLYAAFSGYELREFTDPCMHCHTLEDEAKIHARPLRELIKEDLRRYAEDALLVWGDERDFKHFLPRICELFCNCELYADEISEGYFLYAPHVLFTKFRFGNWRGWPATEQVAVERFLNAIWTGFLSDPPDEDRISEPFQEAEDVVCSIAQCEDDLSCYLTAWIEDERLSASRALSAFILTSRMCTHGVPVTDSFWGKRGAQYAQVQHWLRSAAVERKLSEAEEGVSGTELVEEFRAALSACSGTAIDGALRRPPS
jgi:hypothetical protein